MLRYSRKEPHPQTGSTQKINLVLMLACGFILLVVLLLPRFPMSLRPKVPV